MPFGRTWEDGSARDGRPVGLVIIHGPGETNERVVSRRLTDSSRQ